MNNKVKKATIKKAISALKMERRCLIEQLALFNAISPMGPGNGIYNTCLRINTIDETLMNIDEEEFR